MILDFNGQPIKYGNDYIDAVYIESIRITKNPDKMTYEIGDLFDPTGMIVEAIYSDGSTKEIVDYTYSPIVIDSYDRNTIEVNYINLSDTLTVDVAGAPYLYWDAGRARINNSYYDYSYSPWSTAYTVDYLFVNNTSVTKIIAKGKPSDTKARGMFRGCEALRELDLSKFDTSDITSMSSMFNQCQVLSELDLSNFDTSNVADMGAMFYYCKALTELDLSNFDTSNVTDMNSMFDFCPALTKLDLSNFDTSNVTNMYQMFQYCRALTKLDLSSFNTSNVTNMSSMFLSCSALRELDLSNFDTTNVTDMTEMFYSDTSLETIYVDNCDDNTVNTLLTAANGSSFVSGFTIGTRDGRKAIIR